MTEEFKISSEEAAIYDRQLRVWGFQAQAKMKNSCIGVVGTSGLSIELMKNIVLAGIGELVIFDDSVLEAENIGSNFYLNVTDAGRERAEICIEKLKLLNPKVNMRHVKKTSEENLKGVKILCHIDGNLDEMKSLNELCRSLNIKYVSGNTFGFYGYLFFDLISHDYIVEKEGDPDQLCSIEYENLASVLSVSFSTGTKKQLLRKVSKSYFLNQVLHEYISKEKSHPTLETNKISSLKAVSDAVLDRMVKIDSKVKEELINTFVPNGDFSDLVLYSQGELGPCTAILGGVLAQEVLKAISEKGIPIRNYFVYDGLQGEGITHTIM